MKSKCLHCKNKNVGCEKFCTAFSTFQQILNFQKKEIKCLKAEKMLLQQMKAGVSRETK